MTKTRNAILTLFLAGAALMTVACPPPLPPGAVYVRVAPPTPVREVRVAAPGPDFVWVNGFHRWDGNGYVWVAGRWDRRPRAHAVWKPGHWKHSRHGWYWVDGHWK